MWWYATGVAQRGRKKRGRMDRPNKRKIKILHHNAGQPQKVQPHHSDLMMVKAVIDALSLAEHPAATLHLAFAQSRTPPPPRSRRPPIDLEPRVCPRMIRYHHAEHYPNVRYTKLSMDGQQQSAGYTLLQSVISIPRGPQPPNVFVRSCGVGSIDGVLTKWSYSQFKSRHR